MRFELDIFGDKQVSREILRVGEYADNPRPALHAVADFLRKVEWTQFATQGVSSSGGWPPLAPSTIAKKGHSRILWETGTLARSLYSKNSPFHIESVFVKELVFGTRVKYARYHQLGTSKMPRRRPVELTLSQRKRVINIVHRWVVTGKLDA